MTQLHSQSNTLHQREFSYLATLLRERSAIQIDESKAYLFETRLLPIAIENGLDNVAELIDEIQRAKSVRLTQRVIEAMTTNETSFFRDHHPFQLLRTEIIPKLVAQRSQEKTISIWSNACSTGQEIYSIAMVMREFFPQLVNWRIRLVGTDLSSPVLAKAKSGLYNQTEINRGLPIQFLMKYFVESGTQWQIKEEVQNMVEFRQMNLVEHWPTDLRDLDIIFLRNVLIYFDDADKRKILTKLRACIKSDGYLMLGASETLLQIQADFRRAQSGNTIYYQPGK